MAQEHDFVFIGAGHNGLIAAGYLLKAGADVCVLEKASQVGGAVATEEITLPGFKHDIGAMGHTLIQANPLIVADELELQSKFGLKYLYPEVPLATVFPDETVMMIHQDLNRTCESIARHSAHDAESFRELHEMTAPLTDLLVAGLFAPPPAFGSFMSRLDHMGVDQQLICSMLMSAYDIVNQRFEHEKTKLHLLRLCAESMVAPEESGSAIYLFLLVAFLHRYPMGLPEGGSGQLTQSLARCVENQGGVIVLDAEVTGIDVQTDRASSVTLSNGEHIGVRKAVIAGVDPRVVFSQWISPETITNEFSKQVERIQDPSFVGISQHLALNEPPIYKAGGDVAMAYCVNLVPWLEDFRRIFDDLRYRVPPVARSPLVSCQTQHDSSRAPAGKHTLYLWHCEPWELKNGGHTAWDTLKTPVADGVLQVVREYTTNMGPENVLARVIHSPFDYSRKNPNLVNGAAFGPKASLSQTFGYRPTPELGQYRTPINGLYLVGHATHPGGGVTGGGRAMVQTLMSDFGMDFATVAPGDVVVHR